MEKITNFIIKTKHLLEWKNHPRVYRRMIECLFADIDHVIGGPIIEVDENVDIWDIFVKVGLGNSRSEVKRKFPTKRFSEFDFTRLENLGKFKVAVYIWKPGKFK
jgi:hypothetical protein